MRLFVSFAVCCAAIFACALEPPVDAPPDAGGKTQQAIEPAAQQDETQDDAQDVATESLACQPENDADVDATATSIAPRAEGDDHHWYTPILPIGWVLDLFGHKHKMDPEPDRRKDRKHCEDWCAWEHRQCDKECWQRNPDPKRGFWTRQRCFAACKSAEEPCRAKCQEEFPERPILTLEPEPWPTSSPSSK